MRELPVVSEVRLVVATEPDQRRGLLGYVCMLIDGCLCVDGVALRRTREGRLALSFPCRKDGAGQKHYVVRPLDNAARVSIECQVLAALGLEGMAE